MILITILAQDILDSNYMDSEDCAITRALKRAGSDAIDQGTGITQYGVTIVPDMLPVYQNMRGRVMGMYKSAGKLADTQKEPGLGGPVPIKPEPPTDFSVELPI